MSRLTPQAASVTSMRRSSRHPDLTIVADKEQDCACPAGLGGSPRARERLAGAGSHPVLGG
jgi:hypothetical protein